MDNLMGKKALIKIEKWKFNENAKIVDLTIFKSTSHRTNYIN